MTEPCPMTTSMAPAVARILAESASELRRLAEQLDGAKARSDGTLAGAADVQAGIRPALEALVRVLAELDRADAIAEECAGVDRLRQLPPVEHQDGHHRAEQRILDRLDVTPCWGRGETPSDPAALASVTERVLADAHWLAARGYNPRDHLNAHASLRALGRTAEILDVVLAALDARSGTVSTWLLEALRCSRSRLIARRAAERGLS